MSLPVISLRPVAIGLLLAIGGCGQSGPEQAAHIDRPAMAPPLSQDRARKIEAEAKNVAPTVVPPMDRHAMPAAPDAQPPGYRDENREQYQNLPPNPVRSVAEAPVSTFGIDVDTGSYANVRRILNEGHLPPPGAVRLEEMLNYFPYSYAPPNDDGPFGITTELAPSPWNPHTRLLRIGIKASERSVEQLPPANLVFLVDVSGSMDRREGLPLVKGTLKLLVDQLRPQDKVALVVYAGDSRVVLEPTSGKDKAKIRAAIEQLQAGGATAGAAGIELAYRMAQQGFVDKGINRILLATDGDFNVGVSDFEALRQMAAEKRRSGVSLTTLGFGVDNYNERLMEQLADAGDGNYAYIDNLREARKVLVEQLSSTLAVLAKNVKLQLEFNPARVSEYRLLGYENRALKREDFNNDQVDAGEIGAGHTVTALYEIVPKGEKGWLDRLRYQAARKAAGNAGELAWLRVRWQAPEGGPSRLVERPIAASAGVPELAGASDDLRFAAAVAAFAQQLDGARYTGDFALDDTLALAKGARGDDPYGLRGEFVQLVELARSLQTPLARNP